MGLMGLVIAHSLGLHGILIGLTRSTDHPSNGRLIGDLYQV